MPHAKGLISACASALVVAALACGAPYTTATDPSTGHSSGADTSPPTVSIGVPANGVTVAGSTVTVSANASDDVGVAGVQFLLDGASLGAEDTASPWTVTWNTTATSSGTHVLSARARDAAGNVGVAANVTVIVDNQAPAVSAVSVGPLTNVAATISWTTDEPATSRVEYGTAQTYGSLTAIDSTLVTAHTVTISGLQPQTRYDYRVRSQDGVGNERLGSNGTFTTAAVADTTPPTVPSGVAGRALSSSQVAVSWTASTDNVAVAGYRVFRNGTQVASPSVTSWTDMNLAPGTTYAYAVSAYDTAGNTSAQSAPVSATTLPDTTPPSVPAGLVASGAAASRVNLSWSASSDNVSVSGYFVFRNGVRIATASGTSWSDAGLAPATAYTYAVAAFDPAGNVSGQSATATGTTLRAIAVSPTAATVAPGATQNLSCTVSLEAADTSCSWSVVEGAAGGTVRATGPASAVYSAAATAGTYHVIATSSADASQTATAVLTVTSSAAAALVQHIASSTNPIGISGNAGNAFRFSLPNPIGAGNCLVLGISYGYSPTRTVKITDNNGNAWPASPAATVTDRGNLISSIFVLPNANAGPTQFTVTFDSSLYNFQYALSEFYNVAIASPLNGISTSSTTSSVNGTATLSSGTFTPAVNNDAAGGNLIWTYFASNSDGSTHTVTSWTAGPGFKSLHSDTGWHDQGMPTASEYFVQAAQGPINPGISVTSTGADSYNALSVALKASFAGTPPPAAGIRILRQNISSLGSFAGVTNWTVQFPCVGNLLVLTTPQLSVMPTTSITDTAGNTWVKYAPDGEDPQIWYVANAKPDPNLKITFHMSRAPGGAQSALMYDITGADPNPVDAQGEKLNAAVPGAHLVDSPVITPGSINGLTIAAVTLGQGPISQLDSGSPAGAVFDYVYYANEVDTDLMDNADGRAHLYNSDLTPEHWNWLLVGPTANNNYASVALHFRAAQPP